MPSLTHNTPALRFPGYTGVWEQKQLEDVVTVYSGRDYKGIPAGNIPVYGTGGYMRSISQALSDNNDAIGIGRKGTIDHPFILKAPFWTVDTLFYCVPQHDYDLDFIYGLYQKVPWKALDESTGVPSLSKIAINHIKVLLPSLSEQKQIGFFFHHLDGLINLHQRQTQTLKKLKQGLLQDMFPREGESVPRLRFPGFTDTWEQEEMQDICHYSKTHSEGNRFIGVEDLRQEFAGVNFDKNRRGNGITYQQGDTLMSNIRPYLKKTWLADCDGVCSSDVLVFSPDTVAPDYLHRIISSEHFVSSVMSSAKGSKMPRGDKYQMMKMKVMIPSLSEQRKIGSFFRTLDDLIHYHEQYTVKLTHLKKGLLQKMFPQD